MRMMPNGNLRKRNVFANQNNSEQVRNSGKEDHEECLWVGVRAENRL